jgi:hypothetical protein
MRKIIEGHVYDSDKAHKIGGWDNGDAYGDINYVCEGLYRTKSGLYFVYAEGGANTRYAEPRENNSWVSGESISPIAPAEAQKWAEEYLGAKEYEAEWGTPEEGERAMSARVQESTYQAIRRRSIETGKTMGEVLDELVSTL